MLIDEFLELDVKNWKNTDLFQKRLFLVRPK